jgi:competence ComEA-like helix-hairpin-helix protein
MRVIALVLATLCVAIADLSAQSDWVVLGNCRLILNPANDGDSFHISSGDKEYVIRLSMVDTPEVEGTDPHRLIEQAKYFDITVPQAIEVGEAAKKFTEEKLSGPFTAFTRMSAGMGRSSIARVYGFVQTKDGDLGEQLVRNGLARAYGARVVPPGFDSTQPEITKLQQFEDEARKEKIGGWGIATGRLHELAEQPTAFSFFDRITSNDSEATKKLDINTATKEQLEELPGVGSVLADAIIAACPFKSADDLRSVKAIGEKRYEKLRALFQ